MSSRKLFHNLVAATAKAPLTLAFGQESYMEQLTATGLKTLVTWKESTRAKPG